MLPAEAALVFLDAITGDALRPFETLTGLPPLRGGGLLLLLDLALPPAPAAALLLRAGESPSRRLSAALAARRAISFWRAVLPFTDVLPAVSLGMHKLFFLYFSLK